MDTNSHVAQMQLALRLEILSIPYGPVDHEDGTKNHGYSSLVDDPDLTYAIPELVGAPSLQDAVRALNGARGNFESIRCMRWRDRQDEQLRECLSLGLVFCDRALFADYHSMMAVIGELLLAAQAHEIPSCQMLYIELQRAVKFEPETLGWIMDIYLSGRGADEDAALQALAAAIDGLVRVLDKIALYTPP